MAAHQRWIHCKDVLKSCKDKSLTVPHPSLLTDLVDDMKSWPGITYIDIINYLVFSEGVDGEELRDYKSTEAYYLHSYKIDTVMLKKQGDFIFLKAAVEPSQSVGQAKHLAWVMLRGSGVVETVGCSCIAGVGKSCSHAAALLWKVQNAVISGKTGPSCTDEQRRWHAGTAKNLQPKRLSLINFRHLKAEQQYDMNSGAAVTETLPNTPHHHTHQDFKHSVSKAPIKPLFRLKNTLIGKCYNASPSAEPLASLEESGRITGSMKSEV